MNVLAIRRGWGEEIKKLNKRVELKHTSLNLTKTRHYSLGLFWRALRKRKKESYLFEGGKTENLKLVQQEWRKCFLWSQDGLICNKIMPFHIRGLRKLFNEYFSKEQKCMRSALQLLSDDTFQTRHFSFRGKRLPIKCILLWKRKHREGEKSPEVLSIWPWSAALKWSQWHLASPTKNKRFFFFLVWRKGYRKKESGSNWVGTSAQAV